MLDLSQFVNKKVRVTFSDNDKQEGFIVKSSGVFIYYPFIFRTEELDTLYTKSGRFNLNSTSYEDIIHSEEIKPMNRYEELEKQVAEMQKEIDRLKAENKKQSEITIKTARIGDVLEDGSIVVHKTDNMALLAAPKSTQVKCQWSKEFKPVFNKLAEEGFNPSQWFIPSKEQLQLAYNNCGEHFATEYYWSSTEFNATFACDVLFTTDNATLSTKTLTRCVRAFRVVNF